MHVADSTAGGRIVSVLEGGYDLQGLKESVATHVSALMGATG
jgi:acetoin utilization deacetylase AcuC-like enzyme